MYVQNAIKHQDDKFSRQLSEPYIGSSVKGNDIYGHAHRYTTAMSQFFETFAGEMILKIGAAAFLFGGLALLNSLIFSSMGF